VLKRVDRTDILLVSISLDSYPLESDVKFRILINSRGVEEGKLHGNTSQFTQARSHQKEKPMHFFIII